MKSGFEFRLFRRMGKKLLSGVLGVLLTVSLLLTVSVSAAASTPADFQLRIVHTNDIHSRVTDVEKSKIIGVERLKSVISAFTAGADLDLVLDSGDLFHGQSIATLVQGESVAQLIKACGYDAMTAGNHDWNYGKDRLKELSQMAGLKMLAGNVVTETGTPFFDTEFYTEEVTKNGQTLKVGVFGVIDPDLYSSTAPANVAGLTFTDAEAYAKTAAAKLKNDLGCDLVIALSHTYAPAALAEKVNNVDLWLCGHEHIDLDQQVTKPDGTTAYVIEDGYYLAQAGLIEVDCSLDADGKLTALRCEKTVCDYTAASAYEKNPDMTTLLNSITEGQKAVLDQVVGSTPVALDGEWVDVRIDETNLGRAVTDAYLLETGADVAFENGGGIRATIAAGEVTYGDIISVSPFGNYIVTKKITGKQLKEILETSIEIQITNIAANEKGDDDAWPQGNGSYLQTGGMTVEYNPALAYGSRVISILVGGEKLDPEKLYTVATNNYVATSATFPALMNAPEAGEFAACDEALIRYFRQADEVIAESITTPGMIKVDKTTADESSEGSGQSTPGTSDTSNTSNTQTGGGTTAASAAVLLLLAGAAISLSCVNRKQKTR